MIIKTKKDKGYLSKRFKGVLSAIPPGFMRKRVLIPLCTGILCCLIFISVTFTLLYAKGTFYGKVRDTLKGIKYFPVYLKYVPMQFYRRITTSTERLFIEISPKDYQKLMYWRKKALDDLVVTDDLKQYVRATVRWNDKVPMNVRLRLKGDDAKEHMSEPKWSMRIVTEGENMIMGMPRFSLQHPQRRSYLRSYLFHNLLGLEGLLNIYFNLVEVTINGVNKGMYNIEEVAGQAMIKRNHRKEGIFVRFDEAPLLAEKTAYSGDLYFDGAIKAFNLNDILGDPNLTRQYQRAMGLLNGFRHGDLKASEAFDVVATGRWLAIGDIVGCQHGFSLGNLRLYYNPELDKLQPIGWDGAGENIVANAGEYLEYRVFRMDDWSRDPEIVFWRALFADKEIIREYIKTLDRVTDPLYLDKQLGKFRPALEQYISSLHRDYPQFSLEEEIEKIKANQEYIRRVYLYPVKAFHAYFEDYKEGVLTLGLANRKPIPVEILGVHYQGENIDFLPIESTPFLSRKEPRRHPLYQKFRFLVSDFTQWDATKVKELRVSYKPVGLSEVRSVEVFPWGRATPPRMQVTQR